jgi:hypothetical protein
MLLKLIFFTADLSAPVPNKQVMKAYSGSKVKAPGILELGARNMYVSHVIAGEETPVPTG